MSKKVLLFIRAVFTKMQQDDSLELAGCMAYHLALSIIPILIFLFSLFGFMGQQAQITPFAFKVINHFTPSYSAEILKQVLRGVIQQTSGQLTIIGFLGACWTGSNAASVLIKGLHKAYGLSGRRHPFWYKPVLSLIILVSLGFMGLLSTYFILWGGYWVDWFIVNFHLHAYHALLFNVFRWLIVVVGLTAFSDYIYAIALRPKQHYLDWKTPFWGSVVFVILWVGFLLLLEWYLSSMHQFNPLFGVLGAMAVLLTWLYFSSLALLIGGEITAIQLSSLP